MEVNITKSGNIVYVIKDGDVTVNVTRYSPVRYQSALLFEDEGVPLGTTGDVTELNFVGSAVAATRSGNRVTVTVSGGSGSGDVVGPAVSIAGDIAVFSDTTGKLLADGLVSVTAILTALTALIPYTDRTIGTSNNRYITAADVAFASATSALVANSLRAYKFEIRFTTTLDRIIAEISTGTTGLWRFGLYADDGTGYPGALVVDSGEFTISAPVVNSATISTPITPGIYWAAYLTNTANTARTFAIASTPACLGFPSTLGGTHFNAWVTVLAYQALPNPFPAGATATSTVVPIIAVRMT